MPNVNPNSLIEFSSSPSSYSSDNQDQDILDFLYNSLYFLSPLKKILKCFFSRLNFLLFGPFLHI